MTLYLRLAEYIDTYRSCITLDRRTKKLPEKQDLITISPSNMTRLLCCGEHAAEDQYDGGELVEQLEPPVVNGHLVDLQEVAGHLSHGPNQVRHCF